MTKGLHLIAHNPLVLQLYDKQTGQDVFREMILSSKDDQKFMDFDELVLVARQAEDLSSEPHKNLANFRSEGVDT